jgi:hypothetical protein
MIEKLAINKARTWPEPKDGEPRLHVKSADGEGMMLEHIECWSCHKFVTRESILMADGYCPCCELPIDLDDDGEGE